MVAGILINRPAGTYCELQRMTEIQSIAISLETLLSKSKFYAAKALERRGTGDLEEYQLWASLALELLGKAALAKVHPCLVVDPNHSPSLFVAAGVSLTTDVKTIMAKTLFERLKQLAPGFDESVRTFCQEISERRNAELHSGDLPFRTMNVEAWEARYWHACDIILTSMEMSLGEWIGDEQAADAQRTLDMDREKKRLAVLVKIERSRKSFMDRPQATRERERDESKHKENYHFPELFFWENEHEWSGECPACQSKGFFGGDQTHEEITETGVGSDLWESVERDFRADEFHCPVCGLELIGQQQVSDAGLELDYTDTEERRIEYEPDYGNC
jgi:hypothetical protein